MIVDLVLLAASLSKFEIEQLSWALNIELFEEFE